MMADVVDLVNLHLPTILGVWLSVGVGVFIYLARERPRDGDPKQDAREASKAAVWAAIWPLTAVGYALGAVYRFIAEIGR